MQWFEAARNKLVASGLLFLSAILVGFGLQGLLVLVLLTTALGLALAAGWQMTEGVDND